MKYILSLIIGGALVVSGFGQTRNVLVGTNNAVVQPTNFWSADASNARTGLGLGTAATNPASDFQPSSLVLSNLASSNAINLANINATNIVGIVSLDQGGTGSTNASTARTALGLDTAATNPASAFQPSSLVLSNLASSNAVNLTNLRSTNVVGTLSLTQGGTGSTNAADARTAFGLGTAATNPASAFQSSSTALSNLATGNGVALSNLQATNLVGIVPASNIPSVTFTNLAGTLSIAQGGTGATNTANARQNLGSTVVGDAVFIATNAAAARTTIGALATDGNAINLTNFPASLLTTNGNGAGLTNLTASSINGIVGLASNLSSALSISNGGTGATNAATARTNLGLGWSALTNTNSTNFRNAIGLGATSNAVFGSVSLQGEIDINASAIVGTAWNQTLNFEERKFEVDGGDLLNWGAEIPNLIIGFPVSFTTASNASITRTNLGLPWGGLTNTNAATFQASLFGANTNPVLVNTSGSVVSPTNFWQVAPISTTVQYQTNITGTSINAATNSRNLFLFSLAPSVSGVTNTVTLPTNPATTFEGDRATITHLAQTTNAVTAIRQLGAATNLITLNQLDETVLLMYRSGAWRLADNISYVEPIFFSGTNAAANAAASRTNLGLGATNEVAFGGIVLRDGDALKSEAAGDGDLLIGAVNTVFSGAIGFNNTTNAATTRTNLGIPLPALTNTNNADFRDAIELGATNNVSFSNVTASGTLTATGTVTATTNLVVNGFVDFSTNHTNVAPVTNNQIQKFLQIRIGTNAFFLPLYK